MFIIGLPVTQIIIFCLSIGRDPIGLKMAIVNNELNSSQEACIPSPGCSYDRLSCIYLQHLKARHLKLLPYDTDEEARHAVGKGWAWAAMNFPANFSKSLMERITLGQDADEWSIIYSDMDVVMDMSSEYQMGNTVENFHICHVFCHRSADSASTPTRHVFLVPILRERGRAVLQHERKVGGHPHRCTCHSLPNIF